MFKTRIIPQILVFFLLVFCPAMVLATQAEVDNFDGRFLGARVWSDSAAAVYTRNLTNPNPYQGTYSHQITYDKSFGGGAGAYFGYDAGAGFDLSAYSHFSFMIFSILNNTKIKVILLDANSDEIHLVDQTVDQGAGWQRMVMDLNTGLYVGGPTNDGFQWTQLRRIHFRVWAFNVVETGIFRMDEMQFHISTLAAPAINGPVSGVYNNLPVTWNAIGGATLYEIWGEDNTLFVDANSNAGAGWVQAWPNTNTTNLTFSAPGTYYVKVRAWTAAPDAGGACSLWSTTEIATAEDVTSIPSLNEWGMIILSLLLGFTAIMRIRKQRDEV